MKNVELKNVELIAIENAREGISISDARLPDNPLIYINKGFSCMTGYSFEEAVGKNCRFLQGPETNRQEVKKIRQAIDTSQTVHQEILNYKKDGTVFWNKLSLTPLFNDENVLTHFLGIQEDITHQKELEELKLKMANQVLINKTTLIAEEKLRKEIGEELHDNVNQLLATIKLYLNMAVHQEDMRISMLKKSEDILAITMEEIRKLSRSLIGQNMEGSLKAAITGLIQSIQITVPFNIKFFFDDAIAKNVSQSRKLMFYRIIQEQLNNIFKYAKPTEVIIQLLQDVESIHLSVKDNGIGFDTTMAAEGIGLKNMRNRAEMEKGIFSVSSTKGNGCEIRVVLPFEFPAGCNKSDANIAVANNVLVL